tara:strand:+ start:141 stop:917 length:777 start_codon:yes stop_codon:yes gene_type:complete
MADRKISDLTALTTPASGDYLPIVDISEAAAASKNKRVTIQSLFQGIPVNVGIGTASPAVNLDVASADEVSIRVRATTNGVDTRITSLGLTANAGVIGTYSNHPLALFTNATERARIDSNGRVGIGTAAPTTALDVSSGTSGAAAVINIQDPAGRVMQIASPSASTEAYIGTTTGHKLHVYTNNTVKATFETNGNVGIGTTSPTTLLDVNAATVRVRTARTPASATATGATGEICWDANYIYVCTATNTWKRTALSTW